MAKILVTLTAVLDDGKTALQPGETVSMEEGQAKKLAALGMVKLPKAAKAKNGKSSGKKALSPPDEAGEQDDAPGGDADDGGEAGIGETRDL